MSDVLTLSDIVVSPWMAKGTVLVADASTWRDIARKVEITAAFGFSPDFTAWVERGLGPVRFGPVYRHTIRPHQQIGRCAWATDWYRDPGSAWWERAVA